MAAVTAPANLPELVRAAFVRARAAGDLSFFPTDVALVRVDGIPFQLRFAPALAKKPKAPPAGRDGQPGQPARAAAPPFDPFADPAPGLLVVPQLGPHHRLVLNKFAVCADHAILATARFRPQHHLLDADDLAAAYACIDAYGRRGDALFVFYNSGAHSGASQPHRHLQLLPVARMREGLAAAEAADWGVLADRLPAAAAPFWVAAARLHDDATARPLSADALHATYLALYRRARAAAQGTAAVLHPGGNGGDGSDDSDEEHGRVPARISYNLALTRHTMAILPRTAEGAAGGAALSLNGTVLAGTALVKSAAEWEALRHDPALLRGVLEQIGVPAR